MASTEQRVIPLGIFNASLVSHGASYEQNYVERKQTHWKRKKAKYKVKAAVNMNADEVKWDEI